MPQGRVAECAAAYRAVLEREGCKIIHERRAFSKNRVEFVLRLPRRGSREHLHDQLCNVAVDVRGDVDWEVE